MGPGQSGAGACGVTVEGDAEAARRADAYVEAQRCGRQIPGIALGVMRGGKIVQASGHGLADVENDVPVTTDTVFEAASVGKQFVAVGVMMLVEAGSVKLGDTLPKHFPEAAEAWKEVTVEQLLTHTSGIPDYGAEEEDRKKAIVDFRLDYTEDELVKKFAAMPLASPPGQKWKYSNTGYVLLGFLIHRITGKPYGDFLRQRVFRPLGMSATRVISEEDILLHRAHGYRLVDGKLKNEEWVSPSLNALADGGVLTSVIDIARWDAALQSDSVLPEAELERMWRPVRTTSGEEVPYGMGWGVVRINRHRLVRHRGGWQGFGAAFHRYVDDRLSVVVFANLEEKESRPEVIARKVAALYLPALTPEGEPDLCKAALAL